MLQIAGHHPRHRHVDLRPRRLVTASRGSPASAAIDRRGASVMVLGLVISVLVLLAIGAAVTSTHQLGKQARTTLEHTRALAAAEGVVAAAIQRLREAAPNFEPVPFGGAVLIAGASFEYEVAAVGPADRTTCDDGAQVVSQRYRVTAHVEESRARATVERVIELARTPLFQFGVLSNGDLNIAPSRASTLIGRVHANGDLRLGGSETLLVDGEYLKCSGSLSHSGRAGEVAVRVAGVERHYRSLDAANDSRSAEWRWDAPERWKGTVADAEHGVGRTEVPARTVIEALQQNGERGFYHRHADLVLVGSRAFDANEREVLLPKGTLQESVLFDAREDAYVHFTDVDVKLLTMAGRLPANGLIYAHRTDATAARPNGFRLKNGAELARPLTFVTPAPLYIQGDFNVVQPKPAAVIADAVNLLSNAWNDSKLPGAVPQASSTRYHMCIVTGDVPTVNASGRPASRFENLLRLHEDWRGRTLRLRGSIARLFASAVAKSPWGAPYVYAAPQRDWQFDPQLNDPTRLPPFTPTVVVVRDLLWNDGTPLAFE